MRCVCCTLNRTQYREGLEIMDDLFALQKKIILKALPHIETLGWCREALQQGAIDAGLERNEVERVFEGQIYKALKVYNCYLLEAVKEEALKDPGFTELGITDKVKYLVLLKLKIMAPSKGVARATKEFFRTPTNLPLSPQFGWETVDEIWEIVGDTSTDFNYYTKRGLLLGVYTATLAYWLKTEDPELTATRVFLEKRLEETKKIAKAKQEISAILSPIASCWNNFTSRF